MVSEIENLNPNVYKKLDERKTVAADWDDSVDDPFDEREVFGEFQNNFLILKRLLGSLLYLIAIIFLLFSFDRFDSIHK